MSISEEKQIIGFDMDGVLIDHNDLKIRLAANLGFALKPEQTSSDILKQFVPQETLLVLKESLYNKPHIALTAPLMPGAQGVLGELKNGEIPYVLISRRRYPDIGIRLLSLRGLWPRYFNTKNTFFVRDAEEKNDKAAKLGVTHYVDDELSVLEKLTVVKNKFLFDRFGSFPRDSHTYISVASWPEFLSHILMGHKDGPGIV